MFLSSVKNSFSLTFSNWGKDWKYTGIFDQLLCDKRCWMWRMSRDKHCPLELSLNFSKIDSTFLSSLKQIKDNIATCRWLLKDNKTCKEDNSDSSFHQCWIVQVGKYCSKNQGNLERLLNDQIYYTILSSMYRVIFQSWPL